MSGGVDSSVAAALLKEQGYEVIGVTMRLWDNSALEEESGATPGGCCSLDDLYDARRVADALDIPYYVMNMEEHFTREVVDYFVSSYLKGETPNPCTRCNEEMKFRVLLNKARELKADLLATGHYAKISGGDGAPYTLSKGVDESKDQSYFLFTMNQEELSRVVFPLGGMTKDEVRAYAEKMGIRTAQKQESQEICFVPDDDYGRFISERVETALGGDIVDRDGNVLGSHEGLFRYTIGQRKGLGIGGPGGPYYVISLDMDTNRLVVGPKEGLYSNGLKAREVNWINEMPGAGEKLVAKTRYRHPGSICHIVKAGGGLLELAFEEPERAVTPGQAVVLYRGDELLGGGWIEEAL